MHNSSSPSFDLFFFVNSCNEYRLDKNDFGKRKRAT
jgi:hypothetical protein